MKKAWLILGTTLLVGMALGAAMASKGPSYLAAYLPKMVGDASTRIEGQVVRKQRDGGRLLVKVDTAQGPMLVVFNQKVADLDVLLDPGDTVVLLTSAGYATFVDDPTLEHVKRQAPNEPAPAPGSAPPATPGSPKAVTR